MLYSAYTTTFKNKQLLSLPMSEQLRGLGLSANEIKVYTVLARTASMPVGQLAIHTGLYRTNLYDLLEKLRTRGLVTSFVQNKVRYYSITEPRNLLSLLEHQKEEMRLLESSVRDYIKTLKPAPMTAHAKKLFIYQDREGLQYFYERLMDMAKSRDEVLVIGSSATILDAFNYYILNLSKRIKEINVHVRMIANRDLIRNVIMQRIVQLVAMDLRLLPRGHVSPVAVFIFKSNVGFCNFMENPFVIIVDDPILSKAYKKHFDELWTIASPKDVLDKR